MSYQLFMTYLYLPAQLEGRLIYSATIVLQPEFHTQNTDPFML